MTLQERLAAIESNSTLEGVQRMESQIKALRDSLENCFSAELIKEFNFSHTRPVNGWRYGLKFSVQGVNLVILREDDRAFILRRDDAKENFDEFSSHCYPSRREENDEILVKAIFREINRKPFPPRSHLELAAYPVTESHYEGLTKIERAAIAIAQSLYSRSDVPLSEDYRKVVTDTAYEAAKEVLERCQK